MRYLNHLIIVFSIYFGGISIFGQINYDESKTPNYVLPELLISSKGDTITTVIEWEKIRKPEIQNLFEENVYGVFPRSSISVSFDLNLVKESSSIQNAIIKNVDILFSNGTDTVHADLLIFLPEKKKGPFPLFLGMNFYGNHTTSYDKNIPITKSYVRNNSDFNIYDNHADERSRSIRNSRWPVELLLERGYGLATIYYGDIDPDFDDGFQNGIHKLIDYKNDNDPNLRSSISAWAFGLSAAMDYFEIDNDIDENHIAVFGHSRLGKTALWAGAVDKRFAMVISNNSGCGGAALSRREFGETVKKINTSFPHWFSKNFRNYNDMEDTLPIDQHMLISLIAPRPVYVASAVEDKWADPKGEYLSLYYAGPVYSIYGYEIIESNNLPEINTPIIKGQMGYHIRSGKHNITEFDWKKFLNFADQHFTN